MHCIWKKTSYMKEVKLQQYCCSKRGKIWKVTQLTQLWVGLIAFRGNSKTVATSISTSQCIIPSYGPIDTNTSIKANANMIIILPCRHHTTHHLDQHWNPRLSFSINPKCVFQFSNLLTHEENGPDHINLTFDVKRCNKTVYVTLNANVLCTALIRFLVDYC